MPATDIVTDPDKPSSLTPSSSSCSHFSKLSSPLFSSQVNGDSAGKAHMDMFIQVASKCLSVLALCHWLYQCRPPSIFTMLLFAFKRHNRHNWGMTWLPKVSRKNVAEPKVVVCPNGQSEADYCSMYSITWIVPSGPNIPSQQFSLDTALSLPWIASISDGSKSLLTYTHSLSSWL